MGPRFKSWIMTICWCPPIFIDIWTFFLRKVRTWHTGQTVVKAYQAMLEHHWRKAKAFGRAMMSDGWNESLPLWPSQEIGQSSIGPLKKSSAWSSCYEAHAHPWIAGLTTQSTAPATQHCGLQSSARGWWAGGGAGQRKWLSQSDGAWRNQFIAVNNRVEIGVGRTPPWTSRSRLSSSNGAWCNFLIAMVLVYRHPLEPVDRYWGTYSSYIINIAMIQWFLHSGDQLVNMMMINYN